MASQRKAGIILSYVSIAVNSIIQILYTPFLVGMLGQSEYGLYSLVASIIGYLTVLDLGFGNALVVYTSKYHERKEYEKEQKMHGIFSRAYIIIGIISMLITGIIYLFAGNIFVNSMSVEEIEKLKVMLLILSFNLFMTFAFNIYPSIITAYEKFTFQKVMSILNSVMRPIIMIPLLFMGFRSIAMAVVITVVNVVVLFSNYLYCRNKLRIRVKYSGFDRDIFKIIIGYSIWIFLTNIVDKINWSADQAILGVVCGTVAVSVYSIATTFNQLFLNLSTAISGVMLPKISKMVANGTSIKKLSEEFIRVGRIQFYVIFLAISGFFIFGKQFIKLWVGDGFEESYYVTLLLISPGLFSLIQNTGLSILQALDKYKFRAVSSIVTATVNIIISIFLARKYGAVGAAIGTTFSLVACNIIAMNIYYQKVIRLDIITFWREIFIMMIKMLCPILLILGATLAVPIGSWSVFGLTVLTYVLIYLFYSYYVVMNKSERLLVKNMINKIRRKYA